MGQRPGWPSGPPVGEPQKSALPRPRVRHVWVRPPLGRPGAQQGLVLAWRLVEQRSSPPQWQAFVVVVNDRFESASAEWYYSSELVPVASDPPC